MNNIEIKVFELSHIADANGYVLDSNANVTFPERVYLEKSGNLFGDILGDATLFRKGNSYYIKDLRLSSNYDEEYLHPLTPVISGKTTSSEGNYITKFEIQSIIFVLANNENPKIKSVKEQIEGK